MWQRVCRVRVGAPAIAHPLSCLTTHFDHRPALRRAGLRPTIATTRQHNRLAAAVAATTETEAEAVAEEQPAEATEAIEATEQSERKSFRKERSDRSNKTPITELTVGQQLEGTVVRVAWLVC